MLKICYLFILLSFMLFTTGCSPVTILDHTSSTLATYPTLGNGYVAVFTDTHSANQQVNNSIMATPAGNMRIVIADGTQPAIPAFLQHVLATEISRSGLFNLKYFASSAEYHLSGTINSIIVGQKIPAGILIGKPAQYQKYIVIAQYQTVLRKQGTIIYTKDVNFIREYRRNLYAKPSHETTDQLAAYWLDVALTQITDSLLYDMQTSLGIARNQPFFPSKPYWP